MSKVLVDTNVLIYGIDQDSRFFERARNILENPNYQLVTTSKNLSEFLAVATRSSGYDLNIGLALEILEEITRKFQIIYPNSESFLMFLELMKNYRPTGLKIHDFEIISIGLTAQIQKVATFNTKDFKNVQEIMLVEI